MHCDNDTLRIFTRDPVSSQRCSIMTDNFHSLISFFFQLFRRFFKFFQKLITGLGAGYQVFRLLHCLRFFPIKGNSDQIFCRDLGGKSCGSH